jgi:hypothetical protein
MAALPFTRLNLPDPATQSAVQDLYNKLAQVSAALAAIAPSQLSSSGAKVGDVLTWNGKQWVPKAP